MRYDPTHRLAVRQLVFEADASNRRDADAGVLEPLGQQLSKEDRRVVDGDVNGAGPPGLDLASVGHHVGPGRPTDPERIGVAGHSPVDHLDERRLGQHLHLGRLTPYGRLGEEVEAVVVEVQPGDLGAVPSVELVNRPIGVDELPVKHAVVDDDGLDPPHSGGGRGGDPPVEQRLGVEVLVAHEFRVAERGVAVALDHEHGGVRVGVDQAQFGLECEVRAQHVQGRSGRDEFHVAGRDQRLVTVDRDDHLARVDVDRGQAGDGLSQVGGVDHAADLRVKTAQAPSRRRQQAEHGQSDSRRPERRVVVTDAIRHHAPCSNCRILYRPICTP